MGVLKTRPLVQERESNGSRARERWHPAEMGINDIEMHNCLLLENSRECGLKLYQFRSFLKSLEFVGYGEVVFAIEKSRRERRNSSRGRDVVEA